MHRLHEHNELVLSELVWKAIYLFAIQITGTDASTATLSYIKTSQINTEEQLQG